MGSCEKNIRYTLYAVKNVGDFKFSTPYFYNFSLFKKKKLFY